MEAEHTALSASMRDLLPMRTMVEKVLENLGLVGKGVFTHSTLFEDNSACISVATPPKMTPCSKHITCRCHWWREKANDEVCQIVKVTSELQQADFLTKGMVQEKFEFNRKLVMGW